MPEQRLIDANKLMIRLEKKKSTFFDHKQTEGFNDAIMRVRSMVHSEKTVNPEDLPVVQELLEKLKDKNKKIKKLRKEIEDLKIILAKVSEDGDILAAKAAVKSMNMETRNRNR